MGDETISWDEFRASLSHPFLVEYLPDVAENEAKAKRLFNSIDIDQSGECSLEELLYLLVQRAKF